MSNKEIALCRQKGHVRRTRFQQLWSRVESTLAKNQRLEASLDLLVERIQSEVLPVERQLAVLVRQALERLLSFSERKTLGKGRRAALSPWIDELLDELLDIGHVDHALRDRIARHHALVLEFDLDADSELSDWTQLEDHLEQCIAQEERLRREFLQATEQREESDGGETEYSEFSVPTDQDSNDGQSWQAGEGREATDDCMVRSEALVFKRLFRQTAAALHPDKETDEEKIREKHVLMTRLLQARKEHDLLTLMQLHTQYADAQSQLSGTDERQLEGVLLQHLDVLEKQKHALADKSFLHHLALYRFHDGDKRVVDARFAGYIVQLEQRQCALAVFLQEVRTLKQLRARLFVDADYLTTLW